jgi:hypothetical protein
MTRPVMCVETRMAFRSFAAAGRFARVSASGIRTAAISGTVSGGYHWALLYEQDRQAVAEGRIGRNRKGRSVECEDGRTFETVAAAARALGVTDRQLRAALTSYRPVHGVGLYVRYSEPSRRRF